MAFGTVNYIILFIYLAGMLCVGLFLASRQKTAEQYFLAGRKMPWLVVGMSMFASLTSAVTYMGVPARAYEENISILFGVMVSPLAAPVLISLFYPFYHRLNVTTSYQYVLHRFGKAARFTVSLLFVLARLGWLGVVIYAPSLALSVATGIDVKLAICLIGLLATAYTALGGLSAVLWTDVIQYIILVAGAIWVALSLINNIDGGIVEIMTIASQSGRFDVFNWNINLYQMTAVSAAVSWFFVFLQDYGTDQVTVQRLMAIKNYKGIAKAVIFNSISDVLIVSLLLFTGLGLLAYFQTFPEQLPSGLSGDKILPYYIMSKLPAGVSGLIITAIFAAAMSSMDSGINSLATVITIDFVRPFRKRVFPKQHDVMLARYLTFALGLIATIAAFFASTLGHIVQVWSTVLGLFAGPILAIFLLGMLTKRANFVGWLFGATIAIFAVILLKNKTDVHWVYYFPISFITSFTVGYLCSLIIGYYWTSPAPKHPLK
jgi:solute:Na+ symporter, SSS family